MLRVSVTRMVTVNWRGKINSRVDGTYDEVRSHAKSCPQTTAIIAGDLFVHCFHHDAAYAVGHEKWLVSFVKLRWLCARCTRAQGELGKMVFLCKVGSIEEKDKRVRLTMQNKLACLHNDYDNPK